MRLSASRIALVGVFLSVAFWRGSFAAESDQMLGDSAFVRSLSRPGALTPHFYFNPEVRTAAPSRGKMDSDRPHLYLYGTAHVDLSTYGALGVGYWSDSELTRRVADKHRCVLFENDAIPFYRYVWRLATDWSWRNDLMYDIKFFNGYKGVDVPVYHDICLYSRLDNPHLTPYALIRRMLVPVEDNRFDFRIGLLRAFALPWWGLTLTPGAYVDGGNATQVYRRYGRRPDGSRDYTPGVNAMVSFLQLAKQLSESVTVYAGVEDFHIVRHSARQIEDRRDDVTARNDMFLGLIGLRMNF